MNKAEKRLMFDFLARELDMDIYELMNFFMKQFEETLGFVKKLGLTQELLEYFGKNLPVEILRDIMKWKGIIKNK